ncbi:hypothetical protein PIB30_091099 [Stylosanthes scabra]|uniref:Uncharacterized protein n=1 Tax=Stylosanthes scabra TaxID=79078 RepID=A0ABU6RUD7_9FABA|nr:hypothetical protein [Stylosanthes scabra]
MNSSKVRSFLTVKQMKEEGLPWLVREDHLAQGNEQQVAAFVLSRQGMRLIASLRDASLKLGDHCKYFQWLDEHVAKIGGKFGGNTGCEMISYGAVMGKLEWEIA